jgi:hypothetical protein
MDDRTSDFRTVAFELFYKSDEYAIVHISRPAILAQHPLGGNGRPGPAVDGQFVLAHGAGSRRVHGASLVAEVTGSRMVVAQQ